MPTVYKGDYGYTMAVDCGTDISDSTALAILLSEPDSTNYVNKTGSLSGTTAVTCTIADGDIDKTGTWKVQALVTTASGKFHSTVNNLTVIDPEDV